MSGGCGGCGYVLLGGRLPRKQHQCAIENLRAHWWAPRLLEALTARYVITVEGVADRIIVEAAANDRGLADSVVTLAARS